MRGPPTRCRRPAAFARSRGAREPPRDGHRRSVRGGRNLRDRVMTRTAERLDDVHAQRGAAQLDERSGQRLPERHPRDAGRRPGRDVPAHGRVRRGRSERDRRLLPVHDRDLATRREVVEKGVEDDESRPTADSLYGTARMSLLLSIAAALARSARTLLEPSSDRRGSDVRCASALGRPLSAPAIERIERDDGRADLRRDLLDASLEQRRAAGREEHAVADVQGALAGEPRVRSGGSAGTSGQVAVRPAHSPRSCVSTTDSKVCAERFFVPRLDGCRPGSAGRCQARRRPPPSPARRRAHAACSRRGRRSGAGRSSRAPSRGTPPPPSAPHGGHTVGDERPRRRSCVAAPSAGTSQAEVGGGVGSPSSTDPPHRIELELVEGGEAAPQRSAGRGTAIRRRA